MYGRLYSTDTEDNYIPGKLKSHCIQKRVLCVCVWIRLSHGSEKVVRFCFTKTQRVCDQHMLCFSAGLCCFFHQGSNWQSDTRGVLKWLLMPPWAAWHCCWRCSSAGQTTVTYLLFSGHRHRLKSLPSGDANFGPTVRHILWLLPLPSLSLSLSLSRIRFGSRFILRSWDFPLTSPG